MLTKVMVSCILFMVIVLFLVTEYIVPYTNSKTSDIWKYGVEKRSSGRFYGSKQIWYRSENRIYWIKRYDFYNKLLLGATFYFFDGDFRVIKKIDGRTGVWEDNQWIIKDGLIQVLNKEGVYEIDRFDEYALNIPETPETFVKEMKDPDELSFWEMKEYAEQMKREGYDNTKYLVDMHLKAAYPVILVVMVMIGMSLPLIQKQVRIPVSIMAGILISFFYMVALGFARSLGLSGVFPPFLAAWFSNFLFLLFGAYLMSCIER